MVRGELVSSQDGLFFKAPPPLAAHGLGAASGAPTSRTGAGTQPPMRSHRKLRPGPQSHTSWSIFDAFGSSFATTKMSCGADFAPSRSGLTLMSSTSTEIFAAVKHLLILISVSAVFGSFLRSTAQMRSAK